MRQSNHNKIVEKIYKKYKNAVNMNYTELKIWSKNPESRKASLSREPIRRNLRLLKKNKSDWTLNDVKDANKTISYLARAKKIKRAKGIPKDKLTRNEIAMRNWAYNNYK